MTSTSNHSVTDSRFQILDLIFNWSWRLAILLLPLQTRWFSDVSLLGWPFEQGRLSFYISWIPLILTIIFGYFQPKGGLSKKLRKNIFLLFGLLASITIVSTPVSIKAAAMWWIQIFLLSAFFITLLRANIGVQKILTWFVASLIPHALFGIVQFFIQYVPGSSIIGVAVQDPKNLGVSVVEVFDFRFLRAYGGFPHPNILGGFMAFGALSSAWLYMQSTSKRGVLFLAALPIVTSSLFYSFSRSAWLALAVGLSLLVVFSLINKDIQKVDVIKILLATLLTFGALSAIHWDIAAMRLGLSNQPSRLETQSTSARTDSIKDGVRIFQSYPIFGTGPNAELPALAQQYPANQAAQQPLEPPHNVFVLVLANWGVVGSLIIFGFLLFLIREILRKWKGSDPILKTLAVSLISAWLTISLFDHYQYSLWAGQFLSLLTVFCLFSWLTTKVEKI